MKDEFTMTEYIEEHKLGVSSHDAGATKEIMEHLLSRGYRRVKKRRNGKVEIIWTRTPRSDLKAKLRGLR